MPRRKMSVTQLTLLTSLSMMGAGIIMLPAKFAEIGAHVGIRSVRGAGYILEETL